ncbi:MAG: hypothetical protein K2M60_03235 [Lachnospiraceae bacterium]|nr:hypothetical protein [Lachnospiraceae bacterium]MDE6251821.1 hypothetical protein [Lachnospiraceae bacterium]
MVLIVCMVVTAIPYWLGIIICYALLLFSVIFFITAKVVGKNASAANRTLNAKTSMFRELTDLAQELIAVSSTPEERMSPRRYMKQLDTAIWFHVKEQLRMN